MCLNIEENLNNNEQIYNKKIFKTNIVSSNFLKSCHLLFPVISYYHFFCDKVHSATQMIAKVRIKSIEYFCSFYYWVIFYCMYRIFFLFSTSSPAFFVYRVFDGGHFILCEVIPYWSFDLHFSNNEWCWASFHVLFGHPYVFFGEMSI